VATRVALVLGVFLAACQDPAPGGTDASVAAVDAGAAVDAAAVDAEVAPAACTSAQLAAGDHDYSISAGGMTRTYHVHVPPHLEASVVAPLLLNLHPLVLNGAGQALFSNMNPAADERGFIVAYPDGVSGSWNGGSCCGAAAQQMLDDVGFMRAMIADIEAHGCIDHRRVYATGMSNGGYLSQRLGCEAADVIAAIAPASGVIGVPLAGCQPSRPMPVLEFHGTADSLVAYSSVAPTIATWVARDACTDEAREIYRTGAVHCDVHDHCAQGAKVILCTADGGGHCWPGSASCPVGTPIKDIDGNHYILDFLSEFTLP
jgi:polyhydroxybutyrate depolymerase